MTTDLILPIFDAKAHTYRNPVTGEFYPSVTELMKDAGLIDVSWSGGCSTGDCGVCPMCEGRVIHACAHLLNERDLDPDSVHPKMLPYVSAHRCFLKESGYVPQFNEIVVVSHSQKFAGRVDTIGLLDGALSVIDIKREAAPKSVNAQTYAYAFALREMGFGRCDRYFLELKKSGRYRLRRLNDADGANDFLFTMNHRKAVAK